MSKNQMAEDYSYLICLEDADLTAIANDADNPDDVEYYVLQQIYNDIAELRVLPVIDGTERTLVLSSINTVEKSDVCIRVDITYELPDFGEHDPNYVQYSVSTMGQTRKIKQSLEVKTSTPRSDLIAAGIASAPNNQRVIGLTKDGIEGATIHERGFRFQITAFKTPAVWGSSYLNTLYLLSKTYNNDVFHGFPAGSILFHGAQASGTLFQMIPIMFDFEAVPNANGISDPGFPLLFALGHDLIDYVYVEEKSTYDVIKQPAYRYVHRVYDPSDFANLGI